MTDNVNHPPHYAEHPSGIECIEVTRYMSFCLGNAFKYVFRAGNKTATVEDLKKALVYLEWERDYPAETKLAPLMLYKIQKIYVAEHNSGKCGFFQAIYQYLIHRNFQELKRAISLIRGMIPEETEGA